MTSQPDQQKLPLHITLKWPARPDLALPEVMINAYGADASAVELLLAEAAAAVSAFVAAAAREEERPIARRQQPAPAAAPANSTMSTTSLNQLPPPVWDDEAPKGKAPTCPNRGCSCFGMEMIGSKFGGLFCPGSDGAEADGRCRWIEDERGRVRRKLTKAEFDADRAAQRAGSRR